MSCTIFINIQYELTYKLGNPLNSFPEKLFFQSNILIKVDKIIYYLPKFEYFEYFQSLPMSTSTEFQKLIRFTFRSFHKQTKKNYLFIYLLAFYSRTATFLS